MLHRNRELMMQWDRKHIADLAQGKELSSVNVVIGCGIYISEIKEGDSGHLHGRRAPKPKRRRE